ncbi:acyl carrier protein [Amycolatopsis alba]|uniref:acyl carrier protein n=1 Tax=Amycolatopsis alba TaxID=76020 RepID=UPI0003795608|nr:acyl carrier protein [Amycolatopsis alba]
MTNDADLTSIRETLRGYIAELLYCEPNEFGAEDAFSEIGIDSVTSVELMDNINNKYGLQERAEVVHDSTTLEKLAEFVAEKLADSRTALR